MIDGLYRVTTKYLCAGFTIRNGKLEYIAPILIKNFSYWRTICQKI